jgi:hypothetical protein
VEECCAAVTRHRCVAGAGHAQKELWGSHGTKHQRWLTASMARRPAKVAAITLANKIARMP